MTTARRLLEDRPVRLYLEKVRKQGALYAPLESIPQEALAILVAREDPGFYRHKGVAPGQMLGAIRYGMRTRTPIPGGSTITQQLMKNLYLSPERSLPRKARDIALALRVEKTRALTKDEILELYFNCVEYGPDVYGVADAASYYFGKAPNALTRNQAVILATIAPAPQWRHPIEDPHHFALRRDKTLQELVGFGAMSPQEAEEIARMHTPNTGLDPELQSIQDIFGVAEAPKTADGLVRFARSHIGAPYWSGTYGQTASLGLLNHSRWEQPDAFGGTTFLDDSGKRVFDDAGLVKGYLWSSGADARPKRDETRDYSRVGLYRAAGNKGRMDSFDYGNGRLLFACASSGAIEHVGIYSSEGCVYHAKDRASGVVAEPFVCEGWSFWSGLPEYAA